MTSPAHHKRPPRRQGVMPLWFVASASLALLTLSLVIWLTRPPMQPPHQPRAFEFRVDINQADLITLSSLPGLGQTTGQRIIDYRNEHGIFARPEDLVHVAGIGPAKLEQLKPWIICGPAAASSLAAQEPTASQQIQKNGDSLMESPLVESTTLPGELVP